MIRLKKMCIVREVDTEAEALHYESIGYERVSSVEDELPAGLKDKTIAELTVMCSERGTAVPANVKRRAQLVQLLLENGYVE